MTIMTNTFLRNGIVRIVAILLISITIACSVSHAHNYNVGHVKDNAVINVTSNVVNQTLKLEKNSTLICQGGRFINCTIVGNNTKVVVSSNECVFQNCTFSGTFVNSRLCATNFGCKADMNSKEFMWSLKDKKNVRTKIRYGTDNKKQLDQLAQFCSNSQNLTIEFNGSFYTSVIDNLPSRSEGRGNYLLIKGAEGLVLYGGTLMQGIFFVNCSNLHIHDIRFVGLHEPHDFPTLFYTASSFNNANGSFYKQIKQSKRTMNNTASIVADQYSSFGLAGSSSMRFHAENGKVSKNILVENCSFEMRNQGIGTGGSGNKENIRDVTIRNCSFDHIYFQPIGFSCVTNLIVDNVTTNYCLQPFSISRWANHVTIKNSKFYNSFTGPKQELSIRNISDLDDCNNNIVDNCYIQINDCIKYVDVQPFIFLAGQAESGAVFNINRTTFDVQSSSTMISGISSRVQTLKFTDCVININSKTNHDKYDIPRIFNTGGALLQGVQTPPHIILNNVLLNLKNTRVAYFASPTGQTFNLSMSNVEVSGSKSSIVFPAFSELNKLTMNDCKINLDCSSSLIEKISCVDVRNFTCSNIANMFYNSGGVTGNLSLNMIGVTAKCKGSFLYLINAGNSDVTIDGCNVNCGTIVNFANEPQNLSMKVTRNKVISSATELFKGVENTGKKFVSTKVKVNGNQFSSANSASLYNQNVSRNVRAVFSNNTVSSTIRVP